MAYSQDYRQLALQKLEEGYSIRETAEYFKISTRTLQTWKKSPERKRRVFKPLKIDTELLLKDIEDYPDAYQYERAQRLKCSTSGICTALKRLASIKKKTLNQSKADKQSVLNFRQLKQFEATARPIII